MTFPKINPKSFVTILVAAAPFIISCKDKEIVEKAPATVQEATLEQKKQALKNVVPATSQQLNSASGGGALAVNPPHGQPGHDCAIPVGAPLNSAGTPTQTPAMKRVNSVPSSGNGINPPHGEPGHRCDIKVGDPL
jgi:hypothetical protein